MKDVLKLVANRRVVPCVSEYCRLEPCGDCPGRHLMGPSELYVCLCPCHESRPQLPIAGADVRSWAAALGRRGGKKGGPARAAALSPERRRQIARAAANARWHREGA